MSEELCLFCFCWLAATPKRENNTVCSLIALSQLSAFVVFVVPLKLPVEVPLLYKKVRKQTRKNKGRKWELNEREKHFMSRILTPDHRRPLSQQDGVQRQDLNFIYLKTEWASEHTIILFHQKNPSHVKKRCSFSPDDLNSMEVFIAQPADCVRTPHWWMWKWWNVLMWCVARKGLCASDVGRPSSYCWCRSHGDAADRAFYILSL